MQTTILIGKNEFDGKEEVLEKLKDVTETVVNDVGFMQFLVKEGASQKVLAMLRETEIAYSIEYTD